MTETWGSISREDEQQDAEVLSHIDGPHLSLRQRRHDVSATNRGATRNTADFYATPGWCVDAILPEIALAPSLTFCEPCKGDGVIFDKVPLPEIRKSWFEIQAGRDYLTGDPLRVDLIMTNPPFSLAQEFLQKSLSHARTVVYLLRVNFLGAKKRREFWQENPPSHLFALSRRPSFTGKGTDATEYGWFAWDRAGLIKRAPGIYVL